MPAWRPLCGDIPTPYYVGISPQPVDVVIFPLNRFSNLLSPIVEKLRSGTSTGNFRIDGTQIHRLPRLPEVAAFAQVFHAQMQQPRKLNTPAKSRCRRYDHKTTDELAITLRTV